MRSVAALIAIAALIALQATAHGHGTAKWIGDSQIKNRAGELCCGEGDCGVQVSGTVAATTGGYQVDAVFRITTARGDVIEEEVHEFVPYSEVQPSPDGKFWRCRWGGMRKCFFGPIPNT